MKYEALRMTSVKDEAAYWPHNTCRAADRDGPRLEARVKDEAANQPHHTCRAADRDDPRLEARVK